MANNPATRQALLWGDMSHKKGAFPVLMVSVCPDGFVELFTGYSNPSDLKPILEKTIQIIDENEKRTKIQGN